ncbi:MAG: ATP-grasp domain-containing protein [Gemmataceae bacterium]
MGEQLLIVGASGRAAAASAIRAGFEPFVIDLFADADTKRLCPTLRCPFDDYPHGFIELAKHAPPGPWMYTGGLENHPEVVAAISQGRRLWGHEPVQFANVRDPFRLFSLLTVHAYRCAQVCPVAGIQPKGRWLTKKLNSGGGRDIRDEYLGVEHSTNSYLQEFIPGTPASALYVSTPWKVDLLGLSTQLIGTPWLHAKPFEYAGNFAPHPPSDADWMMMERLGWLFNQYGLKLGLFGVDYIRTDGHPVPIEVNPRYTASVEVYELACRVSVLQKHRAGVTCLDDGADRNTDWAADSELKATRVVGKGVYYATAPITFPASGPWDDSLVRCADVWRRPDYADIPEPGALIEPGQPVLTIFAEADSEAACVAELKRRAAGLDQLFGIPTPEDGP